MGINLLMAAPKLNGAKTALCIQPHADDNEIGMGGTIAHLVNTGCKVIYLTVTNGCVGTTNPSISKQTLIETRRKEAIAAGKHLGVEDFVFLNHNDGSLNNLPELAAEIAGVIRQHRPQLVFCPDAWLNYEAHNDHVLTGKAAAQAFILSPFPNFAKDEKNQVFAPEAIGFYYTAKPNTIVDISQYFEQKFEAIAMHKSQIDDASYTLYKNYFKFKGEELAKGQPFALGEGLKMLAPLHCHAFVDAEFI